MTSIFSGNLYRNFVKDQNVNRLESYDVNRFQRTIQQQSAQGQREKGLREGLEFHQAIMADLQTKLNEVTEKLNNLYRRFMENQVSFRKVSSTPEYYGTSGYDIVQTLPLVDGDTVGADETNGYPAGNNNIVPHDDYDKIRNFSYNPYFGSKAIDQSDKSVIRTNWLEPGTTAENAYKENGAFWSTISYLWGWDLDRINATYATTDATGREDVQINITALQPNKPQYPPLKVGDRFPINWTGNGSAVPPGGNPIANYPAVNIAGVRPGGADYNHATDSLNTGNDVASGTAASNVTGQDSINFGWEFDDLPLAMEVSAVTTNPDGTTTPSAYKIVYDIPPTHPHYQALKILNGTEPMIMDAPTEMQKDVIRNDGFDYNGYTYIPGQQSAAVSYAHNGTHRTGNTPWATNTSENEFPPPKLYLAGTLAGQQYATSGGTGTAVDPIRMTNAQLVLFGPQSPIELSTNNAVSFPTSTTVASIQVNSTATTATTGTGQFPSLITTQHDSTIFQMGDLVTFSSAPGFVYEVTTAAGSSGFAVTPIPFAPMAAGPVNPVPAGVANTGIQLYSSASVAPTLTPKYAAEGLVVTIPPGGTVTHVKTPDTAGDTTPIMTFVLNACADVAITTATRVSMKYRFTVHQNHKQFASPGDDSYLPQPPYASWSNFDWTNVDGQLSTGTGFGNQQFAFPIGGVPYTYAANVAMGAGPISLGTQAGSVAGATGGWFTGTEEVTAQIVDGPGANQATIQVFFNGDLNGFQMEVADVQLVTYDGNEGTWDQGKYNAGNVDPSIQLGDLPFGQADSPAEVINKYIPGLYQFTQFNDQYNNAATTADRNDIVRSPWEFAELQFGDNSGLSGEMFLDLNGRRLNFDFDPLEATTSGWGTGNGTASATAPGTYQAAVSNTNFDLLTGAVASAHDFVAVVHPGDECAIPAIDPSAENYTYAEADPLTAGPRNDTQQDEVLVGEPNTLPTPTVLDPGRTANPGTETPNYYGANTVPYNPTNPIQTVLPDTSIDFVTGSSTDTTGTVDRVGGSVKSASDALDYTITIPTTDVNLLRKENNLLFNFGTIEQRDWSVDIKSLDMIVRTVPEYKSVPRYRVDAGGNIFDQFGKGYYDTTAKDIASADRVYKEATGLTNNDQVSNFNSQYNSNPTAAYNTAGTFENMINTHDRFSMTGDDYNLFDYVPDLNLDPASREGATYGESYIGSLPTNFYWYRELLDNSVGENGVSPTGDIVGTPNFNNDNRPTINFDGRGSNLTGDYRTQHTNIHNGEMPSFTNVVLGIAEQDAKRTNTSSNTTFAVWSDFPGLNGEPRYAISFNNAVNMTSVTNPPINAVGASDNVALMGFPTSSINLNMNEVVNNGGYLILNEGGPGNTVQPHAIPLPLYNRAAPYPNYDPAAVTAGSYSFDGYGTGTVTRTGSKFMPFQTILDGADGTMGGYNLGVAGNMNILAPTPPPGGIRTGGEFATGEALTPDQWPAGVLLHVDDARGFDMTNPKNTITLGTSATRYRIMYRNVNTEPQTMYLIRDDGTPLTNTLPGATTDANGLIHADLQVRELTGTYTVSATNAAGALDINGTYVRVNYNANGTNREGKLASVGLSPTVDRVGRLPGNNPITAAAETNRIGPEIFDSPKGYVQPDAQLDVHLVGQDKDGNQKPRKLIGVRVEVETGEQIMPSSLTQGYDTRASATYNLNGGTFGDWPIAIYDENVQINPETTNDLDFAVSWHQGIAAGSTASSINVVDTNGFKVGQKVTINGEQRLISTITAGAPGSMTLDAPLSSPPRLGDRVNIGDGTGTHDLKLFLNRSLAMSMGAGVKITLEYEEYEYQGYPPRVVGAGVPVFETIGYSDPTPRNKANISPTNTGLTTITVDSTVGFSAGELINVNGVTRTIVGAPTATTITVDRPVEHDLGQPLQNGTITHVDYENALTVGKGRSGGSTDNEFVVELKRIIDNPEYAEVFRHDLFKNLFITASINDPFNDLISSKLFLNWDRIRKSAEIQQSSFTAYYKSI